MKLTATLKNGQKIDCNFKFNEYGFLKPEYPIEYKNQISGWCVKLTKKQVKKLTGLNVSHDENFIKLDVDYKDDEREKMFNDLQGIKELTWTEMIEQNTELKLWWTINSGGNTIIYLPKELKKIEKKLVDLISWKRIDGRKLATITAQELKALVDKLNKDDQKAEQEENAKIEKLAQIAKKTGSPQKLYEYPVECDGSVDGCDIDTIIVNINPDGSQTATRHHSY